MINVQEKIRLWVIFFLVFTVFRMYADNIRKYGKPPFSVVVMHGGPGARGDVASVAEELGRDCGVLEPLQMQDTIAGQVLELKAILDKEAHLPVTFIGHSYGAMLGLVFSAQYPSYVKKLILVSSGVWEEKYAKGLMEERLSRLSEKDKEQLFILFQQLQDPESKDKDAILLSLAQLVGKADRYDPLPDDNQHLDCSYNIFHSVNQELELWRKKGKFLACAKQIQCPVLVIHGTYDVHLAEGVYKPLRTLLKDFRFTLLECCGHSPWLERCAKGAFYQILRKEI